MSHLFQFVFGNRRLMLALALAICGLGIFALRQLPIDAVPDITNVQVMVNSKTGSLSPEQIERQVTFPIESELNGIPGVSEIRSLSKFGLSQVVVVFQSSVDIYWARSQIFERLQAVELPTGIVAELAPITTGLGEVVMYTVEAKEGSALWKMPDMQRLIRLREIQERIIRPEMRRIEGVADVDTNGGYRKEVHINVLPSKLREHGMTILGLKHAVDSIGENVGGGYIQEEGSQIIVGVSAAVDKVSDLENFPVKVGFGGRTIRLKDVAEIRIESGLRVGAATENGHESVLGTILMRSGASSRTVASVAVDRLKAMSLPDEAFIAIHYDRSFLVDTTIRTVTKSLLEGAALVILILILLVGDLRSALLVASIIPISLLGAFIGMKITGVSANLMSLGAIDFGLIVDGAVVMVENFVRRAGSAPSNGTSRIKFFFDSALEVSRPVFFGVLVIITVYLPILFLTGVEGKMFRPMALTVLFALLTSLVLTMTFVPVAASYILKVDHAHETPWLFRKLEELYSKTLTIVFGQWGKILVFGSTALIGVITLYIFFAKIGSDFIPQLDEGDLVIGLVRDTSQGIDESVRQQLAAEKRILNFKEVETVFSRLGTPDSATDPMSVNFADTFVILKKDRDQWPVVEGMKRPRTKAELFEAIKADLEANLPPQDIARTQPIEMRFNEILEGSRADVTLRIYGPDLEVLADLIAKSEKALEGLPGLFEAQYDSLTALTKSRVLEVEPDFISLAERSVNANDLKNVFATALSGEKVGTFLDSDRTIPIVLHLDESLRENEKEIAKLPIDTLHGGFVPLSEVASLERRDRVTTIARNLGQRYSALSLFVKGRDIDSFVKDAQATIQEKVQLPPGYRFYWGGQFRNMQEARTRFAFLIPMTLLIVLVLLYRNFDSISDALVVMGAIPLAMIGGLLTLWLRGLSVTVPAIIGFIALAGVAVMNGVVLIGFIKDLQHKGLSVNEAVVQGAKARLRPVLMTALVAALGFIPMALNTGLGSEVQRPLATVVVGGLVSATLLTLVVLPLVYLLINRTHEAK